jgi:hypothetical protein
LVFIPMNFMGIPFKISKWQSTMIGDINDFLYRLWPRLWPRFKRFHKWVNIWYWKITILKFYKLTTMSIWSLIKNLLWTYMDSLFAKNEPFNHVFTFWSKMTPQVFLFSNIVGFYKLILKTIISFYSLI